MRHTRWQLQLRQMTKIALLSALCVVLRYAFAPFPNIQPISALFFVLVTVEGLGFAVLVMSLSMLISSFLLGFGIWVIFQIISFAVVLVIWRFLPKRSGSVWATILSGVLAFGYGIVIDSLMAPIFGMPWWSYVLAGLPFNLNHALSTLCFYPLLHLILRRYYDEKSH
ncbi:ECF transporter S component [Streptococcus suis]|nr:ECF transporter S component [Streptococcus suis]